MIISLISLFSFFLCSVFHFFYISEERKNSLIVGNGNLTSIRMTGRHIEGRREQTFRNMDPSLKRNNSSKLSYHGFPSSILFLFMDNFIYNFWGRGEKGGLWFGFVFFYKCITPLCMCGFSLFKDFHPLLPL